MKGKKESSKFINIDNL